MSLSVTCCQQNAWLSIFEKSTNNFTPLASCIDGPPPVPTAPGAPMDIKIHDANIDYVIVSWKPPNTTTEGPILGYFVDK